MQAAQGRHAMAWVEKQIVIHAPPTDYRVYHMMLTIKAWDVDRFAWWPTTHDGVDSTLLTFRVPVERDPEIDQRIRTRFDLVSAP